MNQEDIYTKIQTWADANKTAGVTVVRANQNAPRPERPYVTVLVTTTTEEDHASIGFPDAAGNAEIENETAVMIGMQSFGDGAKDILDTLRKSLRKVTVKQDLRATGLPHIRVLSGVNDLSETIGTQFEDRAGMDLEFRAVMSVTDALGVIESVEGTATHETSETNNYVSNYQIGV